MKKQDIINAYLEIRKTNNTIPDDVLDFMKNSAIERLGDETSQEPVLREDEVLLHNLDKNEEIIVPISVKNLLVDKELISFGGKKMVWSYSEHDADEIIKIKNACK